MHRIRTGTYITPLKDRQPHIALSKTKTDNHTRTNTYIQLQGMKIKGHYMRKHKQTDKQQRKNYGTCMDCSIVVLQSGNWQCGESTFQKRAAECVSTLLNKQNQVITDFWQWLLHVVCVHVCICVCLWVWKCVNAAVLVLKWSVGMFWRMDVCCGICGEWSVWFHKK